MIPDIISRAGTEHGDHAAYVTADGWELSYRMLDKLSDEAAVGLAKRGIGEGSVAGLFLDSTVDYVVTYVALAKLGAITAGANPRFRPAERASVLASLAPDVVFAGSAVASEMDAGRAEVIVVDAAPGADQILADIREADAAPGPLPEDRQRAVAICFTSGSTGQPKGALFRNHQLQEIAQLDTGGAWGGGGHNIAPTAFAHVGWMTKMPWILASGATTHLQDRWRAETTVQLIDKYRMGAVTGVAPQVALMLRVPNLERYDFSCVGAIVVGGSASSPALVTEAREVFGAGYSIRYSSTESGGVGLGTALDGDMEETLHTVGRARPGARAEVRDPDGQPVRDGEVGELWLTSPAVMSEYWNNPAATAETLVDGWLRTGDLATVDDRGLFRLSGRVKEMFIRGGYNVYPMEVEAVLGQHPKVADVTVVPRPDPVMGEIGVAVVVPLNANDVPSLDELRAFCGEDLAHYKLPEAIRTVDVLPLNASHKVDRRLLAAQESAS